MNRLLAGRARTLRCGVHFKFSSSFSSTNPEPCTYVLATIVASTCCKVLKRRVPKTYSENDGGDAVTRTNTRTPFTRMEMGMYALCARKNCV